MPNHSISQNQQCMQALLEHSPWPLGLSAVIFIAVLPICAQSRCNPPACVRLPHYNQSKLQKEGRKY